MVPAMETVRLFLVETVVHFPGPLFFLVGDGLRPVNGRFDHAHALLADFLGYGLNFPFFFFVAAIGTGTHQDGGDEEYQNCLAVLHFALTYFLFILLSALQPTDQYSSKFMNLGARSSFLHPCKGCLLMPALSIVCCRADN
jgi:hypothetical protein